MELIIKRYSELELNELYEILKARAAVFVVEQNCIYQDLDGIDDRAYHVFLRDGDGIAAYLRVVDAGVLYDKVCIGRVITLRRGVGLGARIIKEGLAVAKNRLGADEVIVGAQSYAIGFYEKCGFEVISEEYLDEGIPHVKMLCRL